MRCKGNIDSEDSSIHNLEIIMENSGLKYNLNFNKNNKNLGKYYLYVLLNEELLKNNPIELTIGESDLEKS
jgi:hypothetical protein